MEEYKKQLYNATLITIGATAVGFASKKRWVLHLAHQKTLKGALKLGIAVGLGCIAVKFAEKKKWIPSEIKT